LPTFPGSSRTSNAGGAMMVVPADAENPDGGWEFLNYYICSIEGRKIAMEQLGYFPAYLPLFKDESISNATHPLFGDQKVYQLFSELLPEVHAWSNPPAMGEVQSMIGAEMEAFWDGSITAEEFAGIIQYKAESIVNEYE